MQQSEYEGPTVTIPLWEYLACKEDQRLLAKLAAAGLIPEGFDEEEEDNG